MPTRPIPSALMTLRESLRRATDEGMRDRLSQSIAYLERLYGLRSEPMPQDDGDMRRRKVFCRGQHRINPRTIRQLPL